MAVNPCGSKEKNFLTGGKKGRSPPKRGAGKKFPGSEARRDLRYVGGGQMFAEHGHTARSAAGSVWLRVTLVATQPSRCAVIRG